MNQGIIEAHEAGVVTSASVLVNLPAFDDAVRCALRAPALGTGLHFNILLGRPLTHAVTLTDTASGAFLPLAALARRAFTGRVDHQEVRSECAAQIARMRSGGLRVTHLDSHRHAHALPVVWPAVVAAARDAGVPVVRVPLEPFGINPGTAVVEKLALLASWRVASRGSPAVRRPDRFVGISLMGGRHFAARLARLLEAPVTGSTELMVHPGYDDAELARLDPYRQARELELAALTSASVRRALERFERVDFAGL